jgi:hypothetical protein
LIIFVHSLWFAKSAAPLMLDERKPNRYFRASVEGAGSKQKSETRQPGK